VLLFAVCSPFTQRDELRTLGKRSKETRVVTFADFLKIELEQGACMNALNGLLLLWIAL